MSATILPELLYDAAAVRALEHAAHLHHGLSPTVLMERAGAALFHVMCQHWPRARQVTVLAGAGNNGGDGYVLARWARQAGWPVRVLQLGDPARLPPAAGAALTALRATGVRPMPFATLPRTSDVLVDALLGTGLRRAPTGPWAAAIAAIAAARAAGVPVLAADLPSGLHADTGACLGPAVRADVTLTFIALKPGLLTGAGPACCGLLRCATLGVPSGLFAPIPASARRLAGTALALPPRARTAHKGDCGRVLVVGGAPGMSGAARLCAVAALRAGAGLVTLGTHPAHAALVNLTRPELMTQALPDAAALRAAATRATVVALGPGLGQDDWAQTLFAATAGLDCPLVLDADALNLLAAQPRRRDDWVLTPHPGEAARLLRCTVADIAADRFAAARALRATYGGTIVLKGAGTIVHGEKLPAVCAAGNPGMASGGMGDALAGLVAALIAQGLSPDAAATTGVYIHARAGDRAARNGERGLLASDLIDALPATLVALDSARPGATT